MANRDCQVTSEMCAFYLFNQFLFILIKHSTVFSAVQFTFINPNE